MEVDDACADIEAFFLSSTFGHEFGSPACSFLRTITSSILRPIRTVRQGPFLCSGIVGISDLICDPSSSLIILHIN